MNKHQSAKLIELFKDQNANAQQRADAARRLADMGALESLGVLIEGARDPGLAEPVGRAAGAAVARLLKERAELNQIPLEDFTGPAYLGYDEAASALLRR